jgi:hypothetical protein
VVVSEERGKILKRSPTRLVEEMMIEIKEGQMGPGASLTF